MGIIYRNKEFCQGIYLPYSMLPAVFLYFFRLYFQMCEILIYNHYNMILTPPSGQFILNQISFCSYSANCIRSFFGVKVGKAWKIKPDWMTHLQPRNNRKWPVWSQPSNSRNQMTIADVLYIMLLKMFYFTTGFFIMPVLHLAYNEWYI